MSYDSENRTPRPSGAAYITILGRLGADPELHAFNDERGVVRVRLAVTHVENNKGEKSEQTTWYGVDFFTNLENETTPALGKAGMLFDLYRKGDAVTVMGKLEPRNYPKKDGSGVGIDFHVIGSEFLHTKPRDPDSEESSEDRPVRRRQPASSSSGNGSRRPSTRRSNNDDDDEQFPWG